MARPLAPAHRAAVQAVAPLLPEGDLEAVYLPLAAWLKARMAERSGTFLIGIAGSVSAGKSTVAQILATLLRTWGHFADVQTISTDGFLYPTATLEGQGLLHRKGFPESYEAERFFDFARGVRSGQLREAPLYSHHTYDRLPHTTTVYRPDVLFIEGINVLQPLPKHPEGIRPLLDVALYIDADDDLLLKWFLVRFRTLLTKAQADPSAYLHRYIHLDHAAIEARAMDIWHSVNLVNLHQHIAPTRAHADLILEKSVGHRVKAIRIRIPP